MPLAQLLGGVRVTVDMPPQLTEYAVRLTWANGLAVGLACGLIGGLIIGHLVWGKKDGYIR